MVFEQFQKDLVKALGTDVTLQYGCIGSHYTKILAIKKNKIVEIGEFSYSVWQNYSDYKSTKKMLADMYVKAIMYYYERIDKIPCLFINDYDND